MLKKWTCLLLIFILSVGLVSCSLFNAFYKDPEYQQTILKGRLRVSISLIIPEEKDLQKIYEKNAVTTKELETNRLVFIKIKYNNQSSLVEDIYSFNYKLMSFENNSDKSSLVDTDQKGFDIPSEIGFNKLDKLSKIEPKMSLEGYLPFWIPNNTKIFAFSIIEQRTFDMWCVFYF